MFSYVTPKAFDLEEDEIVMEIEGFEDVPYLTVTLNEDLSVTFEVDRLLVDGAASIKGKIIISDNVAEDNKEVEITVKIKFNKESSFKGVVIEEEEVVEVSQKDLNRQKFEALSNLAPPVINIKPISPDGKVEIEFD